METVEMDFSEKVVLVTGASAGIGEAIAVLFAEHGAKLALVARTEDNLRKVAKRCQAERGTEALVVVADLATDGGCKATAKQTLDHFGRLDILINNAGISVRGCIEHADMATFDAAFNLNVRGVYHLTQLLVPALIASKGNIVNISSIAGSAMSKGRLPYSMSKAALDHFTKLIALELAPKGVRVNAVSPGITESSSVPRLLGLSATEYEAWLRRWARRVPLGAACGARDVAAAVLLLAGSGGALLTAVNLPVDGGLRLGVIPANP